MKPYTREELEHCGPLRFACNRPAEDLMPRPVVERQVYVQDLWVDGSHMTSEPFTAFWLDGELRWGLTTAGNLAL